LIAPNQPVLDYQQMEAVVSEIALADILNLNHLQPVSFLDDIDGGLAKACDLDILAGNGRGGFGKEAATDS